MTGELVITWDRVPLKDICEQVNYGYTASAENDPVGPKFLRITDIVDELIDWESVPYCKISDKEFAKYELQQRDIVVARTGATSGYAKMIKKHPKAVFASYLVRLRIKEEHDWRYVGLLVESDDFKRYIKSVIGGAAQPQANAQVLTSFPIPLPPLPVQHKIAAILSAYDDLIENNTRRIKILEEMAQMIYREWFVNFRFLGHEKVHIVDSKLGKIPEGWEIYNLGQVLASIESGSRPKGGIDPNECEVPSIGAENIIGLGKYDFSKEKYVSREFYLNIRRGIVHSKDVLLYKDGAQIGRKTLFRDGFPHQECCINEHVFILRTNSRISQNYLFFWLDQPDMTQNIRNLNANAAQPGINQESVRGLPLLIPPETLIHLFDERIEPLLTLLFNLANKNVILNKIRDLLLPRLISGELDVSNLDIVINDNGGN